MPCPTLKFTKTPDEMAALRKELNSAMHDQGTTGAGMNDLSGTASHSGATIDWSYDPPTQTLSITCTSKPWYASCDLVNGKLTELVESVTGTVQG